LLVLQGDDVLVEQRPGAGIWGGLLSLPQFDRVEQLAANLARLVPDARAIPLPQRRHAFTHFTLQFTPHLVQLERPLTVAMEPQMRWLARDNIDKEALPTPIRVLLYDVMRVAGQSLIEAPGEDA
jgi:A/G-specific adenine glycosylase